ncbi:hypothetical protein KCP69_25580 [Salmonella enterica subsp. enterica]|nr:hypothetical protein KCP69_25580 [Salmonella enterica subsp. enterica]
MNTPLRCGFQLAGFRPRVFSFGSSLLQNGAAIWAPALALSPWKLRLAGTAGRLACSMFDKAQWQGRAAFKDTMMIDMGATKATSIP